MLTACAWKSPPDSLALAESDVHVWRCELDGAPDHGEAFRQVLDPGEQRRAQRLVRITNRHRWIAARGWLRLILARYLRQPPRALQFTTNAYGRPALAGIAGAQKLHFNQSHSNELTLIAIGCEREIGVDLEFVRADIAVLEIGERFFAPGEVRRLRQLAPDTRLRGFYQCWTRKEAFVKACGQGLSYPLDRFEVAFGPDAAPALLHVRAEPNAPRLWRMENLEPHPDYAAALVVAGHDWMLQCWDAGWEELSSVQ